MRARFRIGTAMLALTAAIPMSGCSRKPDEPTLAKPDAISTAIGSSAGRFVGSEACRSCHAVEFGAWEASRHHSTLRAWEKGQPLRLAATAPAPYRVESDGKAAGPGADGKELGGTVAYLLGGRHREDVVVRLPDGRMQVFPIAFDADQGRAFEPLREIGGGTPPPATVIDFWTRVGRNFDLACYGCHATGQTLTVAGRSPSGLALPASRWVEPGVGCEACHGPGGPHVDAAKVGKPGKDTIKMPHGSGGSVIDACAACHGLRDALPSPFASSPAHHYGEPVTVAANPLLSVGANAEFREAFFADLRPSTYQQEAIAFSQSGCARKGGMSCAACHDVHSGATVPALAAPDGGDSICASCHASVVAMGPKHTLHEKGTPGGRCLDCHMAPILRGPARDPSRDHSMAPPVAGRGQVPAACAACHTKAADAGKVIAAWKRTPEGAAAKSRLAVGAAVDAAASAAGAAPLARLVDDANRGWFLRWAALETLADRAQGPPSDVVLASARRALADANPAIRRVAARVVGMGGKTTDIDALERVTSDPDPWAALEAVHAVGLLGSPTAGPRLLQLLKRPDLIADARAQYMAGHGALIGQDPVRAERALRRALEINPMIVGAMNDLGLALIGQGKRDEAIKEWERALDINPRLSTARANLDAAKSGSAPAK